MEAGYAVVTINPETSVAEHSSNLFPSHAVCWSSDWLSAM